MKSLNLKSGDEVIIPDFAYVSPAEVAALLKLKIKFVDVDYDTFLIDPINLKKNITKKTRVIVVVSLFGQCPNFTEIKKIIGKKKITLIEDAAQSFGAKYKNQRSCNIADISVLVFSNKNFWEALVMEVLFLLIIKKFIKIIFLFKKSWTKKKNIFMNMLA